MRNKFGLVILGVTLVGVSGCSRVPNAVNPISWYRDVTGISKNDNLGKGENEENFAEGGNEPYPNLASVPAAPDTQLSGVDRDRLEKSLVADRSNAQYSADNLRAGDVASTVPAPARNTPGPSNAPTRSAAAAIASAPASSSSPPSASPPSLPADTASAAPPPPAASSPPKPAPEPSPSVTASSALPANSTPSASAGSSIVGSNSQQKAPPRGSEAPPAESSLQSPAIANLPQGESPTPAPPPPQISPPNSGRAANAAPPLASRVPAQQATAPGNAPATAAHAPGASYRVANVSFAPGSAYLPGTLRGTISEIAKTHSTEGGTIRVVGFGEASGKDAAVTGLTLALDRAQAVAVALTDAGVAAKDIAVEAAPVAAKGGADAPRAEVYIEH